MCEVRVKKLTDESLAQRACQFTLNSHNETKIGLGKLYQCEHSPIRTQMFWVELMGIPSFVSVHLVRHKYGVEHYVQSMREDSGAKTKADRDTLVNHAMLINAQALINMARKRLCHKASKETRSVVGLIRSCLSDEELVKYLVPECEYRGGHCHEIKPCSPRPF